MKRTPLRHLLLLGAMALLLAGFGRKEAAPPTTKTDAAAPAAPGLWAVYEQSLKGAKYIDLTHTLAPDIPVWKGFGPSRFAASVERLEAVFESVLEAA